MHRAAICRALNNPPVSAENMNALAIKMQAHFIAKSKVLILAILKHHRSDSRLDMYNGGIAQPFHQQHASLEVGAFAVRVDKCDMFRPHTQFDRS